MRRSLGKTAQSGWSWLLLSRPQDQGSARVRGLPQQVHSSPDMDTTQQQPLGRFFTYSLDHRIIAVALIEAVRLCQVIDVGAYRLFLNKTCACRCRLSLMKNTTQGNVLFSNFADFPRKLFFSKLLTLWCRYYCADTFELRRLDWSCVTVSPGEEKSLSGAALQPQTALGSFHDKLYNSFKFKKKLIPKN